MIKGQRLFIHHSSFRIHHFLSVSGGRHLARVVRVFVGVVGAALGLPAAAQGGGVEGVARAVAQVLDLVADEGGDEAVGFRFRHPARQVFEFFGGEEATDARADLAALEHGRAFGERLVGAVDVDGQDAGARREREVGEAGFELGHLARHRARAFGEDERRVAALKERARVAERLS